jgi:hypothetical protein
VRTLAGTPTTLTEVSCRFPQSLQADSGLIPQIRPRHLPSVLSHVGVTIDGVLDWILDLLNTYNNNNNISDFHTLQITTR